MRLFPKILISISIFLVGILVGNKFLSEKQAENSNQIPENIEVVNTDDASDLTMCPKYEVGTDKGFDGLYNEPEVVYPPVAVENPQPFSNKKKFVESEFEASVDNWDSREFDVNGDGDKEMIISANVAMTRSPHVAAIVDDGEMVFEAGGTGIWISESYSKKGFMLTERLDYDIGIEKNTRYIFDQGSYIPVWYQKVCWVKPNLVDQP